MTNLPTTPRPGYLFLDQHCTPSAHWHPAISRVVIKLGDASLHLDPAAAAELAAELIGAVRESGAGEVPAVLLAAFDRSAS